MNDVRYMFLGPESIPPYFPGFPHLAVLLPRGIALGDLGGPSARAVGVFLIDPDAAYSALNDRALDGYLREKVPVLFCASRVRDLRPFLRRADRFKARGFSVELVAAT